MTGAPFTSMNQMTPKARMELVSFLQPFFRSRKGAGGGGGIQFDLDPQTGDWLWIKTTGFPATTVDGFGSGVGVNAVDGGIQLQASVGSDDASHTFFNLYTAGDGNSGIDVKAQGADNGGVTVETTGADNGGVTVKASGGGGGVAVIVTSTDSGELFLDQQGDGGLRAKNEGSGDILIDQAGTGILKLDQRNDGGIYALNEGTGLVHVESYGQILVESHDGKQITVDALDGKGNIVLKTGTDLGGGDATEFLGMSSTGSIFQALDGSLQLKASPLVTGGGLGDNRFVRITPAIHLTAITSEPDVVASLGAAVIYLYNDGGGSHTAYSLRIKFSGSGTVHTLVTD